MLSFTKKNTETRFGRKLEILFWWIVRLLPIIFVIIFAWKAYYANGVQGYYDFGDMMDFPFNPLSSILYEYFGFEIDNDIANSITFVFSDILGLASFNQFSVYLSYLVYVELCRLFVDFLLFIPRLSRKWLNVWTQQD